MQHVGRSEKWIGLRLKRKTVIRNKLVEKNSDGRCQVHTEPPADGLTVVVKSLIDTNLNCC